MSSKVVQFTYKYKNFDDQSDAEITVPVKLPCDEDDGLEVTLLEILREMNDPSLMKYLDEDDRIRVKLREFITVENQKYEDEYAERLIEQARTEEGQARLEAIIRETERHYKEEILQFADRVRPTDEEIFAQSFHRLVHSSSLEEILQRERSYAKIIADMTNNMEKEVEALNSSQQEEMESKINQLDITTTSEDINNLLAQQYTTQSYVRKRFESELEAMKGHQRNEYRNWITGQVSRIFQTSPVATPLGNRSSMFVSQQPSMEESFTIHLGSQLKHMHNIRILSANVTDLCSPLHADESLNGLNMALGLYSSSLCGVVVLTPSMQAQANKDIIRNANQSTEFHFDQIDDQLEKIEERIRNMQPNAVAAAASNTLKPSSSIGSIDTSQQAVVGGSESGVAGSINSSPSRKAASARLKTGDFFITKHSNLSQSHVIFHLISDEPINSPSEINSRHPVILGLRNILKIASRHDVTTLTIPALLRHEMSEDMTIQWCVRRAELVFKCAKGFMIESATWGGAELSTLQLLLPHDISEELFSTLAAMVPNVFRVANPKILVDNTTK